MILSHLAFRIANHLRETDVVCLTDDEAQTEALAQLLTKLAPDSKIVQLPSSPSLRTESNSQKRSSPQMLSV